jgi:hypothetical protein
VSARWEQCLEAALAADVLWDEGVEAARNACVAGAPLAAAAISAAAWYDNPLCGGRALLAAYTRFAGLPNQLDAWRAALVADDTGSGGVPGFGFVSADAAAHVLASAQKLRALLPRGRLEHMLEWHSALSAQTGALNVAGLCALVFLDAGLDVDAAERRFLLLRLAPALAAAQRAKRAGLAGFPFFESSYRYEGAWPQQVALEPCSEAKLSQLKQAVGLDP